MVVQPMRLSAGAEWHVIGGSAARTHGMARRMGALLVTEYCFHKFALL
jgi:hypothetical protein